MQDERAPVLSVIIVNYNGLRFLDDCIASLRQHVHCSYEVIVVDNASQDGSIAHLRAKHTDLIIIASRTNTGFTGGNNLAAASARGKYLLLLNNDTRILTDIGPAILTLEAAQDIGALGCRLYYGDGRPQPSYGYEHHPLRLALSWLGLPGKRILPSVFTRTQNSPRAYNTEQADVSWVSGACLFTRKSLWERLQGLDQGYFMYAEDVDYCKRVRQQGFRVSYVPTVRVVHHEGAGRPWIGSRALLYTADSYLRFTRKFYGFWGVILLRSLLAPIFLMRSGIYLILATLSRKNRSVIKEKHSAYLAAGFRLLFGTTFAESMAATKDSSA